jgi:hypothetical protein
MHKELRNSKTNNENHYTSTKKAALSKAANKSTERQPLANIQNKKEKKRESEIANKDTRKKCIKKSEAKDIIPHELEIEAHRHNKRKKEAISTDVIEHTASNCNCDSCNTTKDVTIPSKKRRGFCIQQKSGSLTLSSLPDDILREIFKYLDISLEELCHLRLVCRRWCILLSEDSILEGRYMFSDSEETIAILFRNEVCILFP